MSGQANDMNARESASVSPSGDAVDRRGFLSTASSIAMAGGLVAGYGTLAVMAGKYLFQSSDDTAWLYVAPAEALRPGESLPFESPVGVRVVITRKPAGESGRPAAEADFLALSSVCPHLGCRVHWESQNNRFFCPCHNGSFDAAGKATGGPPLAAGQALPQYPLRIEEGMLFIKAPIRLVGGGSERPGEA
jgi:nitrite reductase/ring-hydroxylating ferredoxin subunit